MHFYLESANPDELREALAWRVVEGVTTDPGLLAREGRDPQELIRELCEVVNGPVLVEVTSSETASIVREAEELSRLDDRILVRIPCTPAGIPAIAALADRRIPVDASLVFGVTQGLMAAKAGARFLSVPVGEMDAAGGDGLGMVGAVLGMLDQYQLKTSVQATSLAHPGHVAEVARMGADAGAVDLALLRAMADHPLTALRRREQLDRWREAQN